MLSSFWLPVVIVTISCLFCWRVFGYGNHDVSKSAIGIMLGVLLGFTADITKRSWDDFQQLRRIKKAARTLLRLDAQEIARTLEIYRRAQRQMPNLAPLGLPLHNWERLQTDNSFLVLAAEKEFERAFAEFWEFEKINAQLEAGRTNFAFVMTRSALDSENHKKLLRHFMSAEEANGFLDEVNKQQAK
jgi:hypothetical protein